MLIHRLYIMGILLCLLSQAGIALAASTEERPMWIMPILSLLLDDSNTISLLGSPDNIQTTTNDIVSCSRAIFDSDGNAYVLWNQGPNYSSDSVWASRYTSTSGWGAAATIESNQADIWGCPAISAGGNGNVFVVWSQSGVIMINRYLASSGWNTPEIVGGSNGLYPSVAVDANDNVFVVWQESGGVRSIWSRRYEAGVGWGTATTIESYSYDAYEPSVVVDTSGNATVVWAQQIIGLLFSAAANHYTVGDGWGTPAIISTGSEGILNNSVVADIDANDNVFAAWSQGPPVTGGIFTVRSNRYVPGSGWGTPETIDEDLETTSNSPNIASASEDTIVVWSKYDQKIYAEAYSAGSGWGTATAIATGGGGWPNVAINSTGKVTVAWSDFLQLPYSARAIQYTSKTGWGDVQLLAPSNSPSVSVVRLATDDAGNFLATWTEGPGPTHNKVMVNLFQ